jgi:hypothetical protein
MTKTYSFDSTMLRAFMFYILFTLWLSKKLYESNFLRLNGPSLGGNGLLRVVVTYFMQTWEPFSSHVWHVSFSADIYKYLIDRLTPELRKFWVFPAYPGYKLIFSSTIR